MSGYIPNAPKGYRNRGVEPVNLGAQRWAEYKKAFPEIEKSGGVIVGKGKPGFPGGTIIPPTRVDILQPK
ncbi:hypothetical protein [Pseudomonas chlororaphis]|uniref:hypothetical protein n=1 Tax=Pseudomonas chlororaphis TaxID=587753 RepID=UPI0009B87E91|nr:hypothetical protein [Pseudomonas chlororaphis]